MAKIVSINKSIMCFCLSYSEISKVYKLRWLWKLCSFCVFWSLLACQWCLWLKLIVVGQDAMLTRRVTGAMYLDLDTVSKIGNIATVSLGSKNTAAIEILIAFELQMEISILEIIQNSYDSRFTILQQNSYNLILGCILIVSFLYNKN